MKTLVFVFSALVAFAAQAQPLDRRAELDKAVEEARTASLALKDAEARRDQGVEPAEGDRLGTSAGGTRPSPQYLGRQQQLEMEVELARKRYDAALKRWNDLK
jgi:hypothetical protein